MHDSNERLIPNAKVTGSWSGGVSAIGSCTTSSTGRCSLKSPQLANSKTSVTFTIKSVQYGKLSYQPNANHDPDGDSTGTFITVHPPLFKAQASSGGSVLESSETSSTGWNVNASAPTFNVGDDSANKQYRAILSFKTSALPDNAVITKITLALTKQSVTGSGDPFSLLHGLVIDIRKGYFGPSSTVEAADFRAASSVSGIGPYSPAPVLGVYTLTLNSNSFGAINKLSSNGGVTQLRLRFGLDDNNNHAPNYISFYNSYSLATYRPRLTITYYIP